MVKSVSKTDIDENSLNDSRKNFSVKKNENKIKTIVVKVDEDFIENNLIDLPFIYYYNSKNPITAITYSWETSDGRKRAIEVRGSKYGVPDPYCYDLLIALFRIYVRQNENRITINDTDDENDFENQDFDFNKNINNRVNFSYRELAKEMGYKSFGKKTIEKMTRGIETLLDTNLYNTSQGGFYNPITKEYITDATFQLEILRGFRGYKYIDAVDIEGNLLLDAEGNPIKKIDMSSIKGRCSVEIHGFFIRNLLLGNGKISNKNIRLNVKGDIAKKLYLILNKWQNKRNAAFFKFETLYNRIPLTDDKSDYYRKKRLLSALDELVNIGFLESYIKNKEGVEVEFSNSNKAILKYDDKDILKDLLIKYNKYSEIENGFKKYGVTQKTLDKHIDLSKIQYYQALLRMVDYKVENKTLESPSDAKAYVLKGLLECYENIDKKFYNK